MRELVVSENKGTSLMKKMWTGVFALLILAFSSHQAMAQSASTSLNGIWLNTTTAEGGLAFLTIIHKADQSLAIISTNLVNLFGVQSFQSAASLGQADPSALGQNVGSLMSVPALFLGADLQFAIHRPAENELMIELLSCDFPVVGLVSCDQIYDNFRLNVPVHHTRAF